MRISDWSSDVCSSDLLVVAFFLATGKISFDQFIARPIHPWSAIDGAKITPFPCEFLIFHDSPFERIPVNLLSGRASIFIKRPVRPDMYALLHERPDICLACKEP